MQTNLKMYKTRLQTLKASLDSDVGNMKDITADIKKYEDKVKYVETSILAQSAVAQKEKETRRSFYCATKHQQG